MSNVNSLTTIINSALQQIAETYEAEGKLPNLSRTDDTQSIMISMGQVALNFTIAINVVSDEELGHYSEITAYFSQEDFIYPEGATRENAVYIIRAAPYYRVFSDSYPASGDTLEEAMLDTFYVVINEMENIVALLSNEIPE